MIQIHPFAPGLYLLEDEPVRQFLFVGGDRALLIDTGFAHSGVAQAVKQVTDLPVTVVLTHGDRDHTGGLGSFPQAYLHPADWPLVETSARLLPLAEGDVFSCGEYRLEVVEIPGHTGGSVALLDREHRLLLPGDSVQAGGPIYMFGPHRSLDQYIASLEKLGGLARQVDTLLPCHHRCPIDPSCIEKNRLDAMELRAGRLSGTPHPTLPCSHVRGRWTEFYANP